MNISLLLEMVAEAVPERVAVGSREGGLTYGGMLRGAAGLAAWLQEQGDAGTVGVLDRNSPAMPLLLFAAARLGRAFVPLNYRLAAEQLAASFEDLAPAVVMAAPDLLPPGPPPTTITLTSREAVLAAAADGNGGPAPAPDAETAVMLFTSGTSGAPKAALLHHDNLFSYVISTVEFLGAAEDDAALVSVPPYHIAGISAILSSTYAGRRVVQLEAFDPRLWVDVVREESITHAMVVPTMLQRILDVLAADGTGLPTLRHLSYGGGRMPLPVVERAIELLPGVDLVNAYGLTETSSTIAVLGPEDHRTAAGSDVPAVRRRLGSVGRPLPGVEIEIRDDAGGRVGPGTSGEIHVRGDQVSGQYLQGSRLTADGWFPTRDGGYLDEDGFLFVEGRLDDVIVRGGENLSPGEIEEVILRHAAVADVAVVGLPDTEWGQQVVAVVVAEAGPTPTASEIQDWVRARLRSARTPSRVFFVDALPYNETGKVLRRKLPELLGELGVPDAALR